MAEPQLAGQTVVVLGGSAGIGLATARRARAEGANVVITGRDPERLARAAADLGSTETAPSTHIQTAPFDVADEAALHQFFDQLSQRLDGPIGHVLVSAGGPYYAPFAELDVADAMRYVSRSLALPLNVARFFDGLELVEPGLVQMHQWRADAADPAAPSSGYAVVGRKP